MRPLLLLAAAVLAAGPGAAAVLPDFGAATFIAGAPIDNQYFPLLDRRTRLYQAFDPEDGTPVDERFELRVLSLAGPTILGVQTTIQQDLAYEEGRLVEKTFDYYAQDTAGNVWYFGEDVTNYVYDADGNLIETNGDSTWRAGVNSALPGFIMPADLTIGFNYFQEFAPFDEALDEGTTFATDLTFETIFGTATNVMQVLETSALFPARGFKYYAPGIGLIREEEGIDAGFGNPSLIVNLVGLGSVPEPSSWALLIAGFGLIGGALRRRRGPVRVAA